MLGDLAFVAGAIGIFIYICLIVVRYANQASQISEKAGKYESEIQRLQQRFRELKEQRAVVAPEIDAVVAQMVELRDERDRLQVQYEEMQVDSQRRDIDIKTKRLG